MMDENEDLKKLFEQDYQRQEQDYQKQAEQKYNDFRERASTGQFLSGIANAFGNAVGGNANSDAYYANALDNAKKETLGMVDEKTKKDPNSAQSKMARTLAKKYGQNVTDNMSYWDISQMMDPRKMMETEAAANVDFEKQKQLRQMDERFKSRENALDRYLKMDLEKAQGLQKNSEKSEKQKQTMNEVSDRYLNIKDAMKNLKKMVEKTGGGTVFGPENKQMDQYMTSIATDMAKLVDPQSVARESEVQSFKNMLFEPGIGAYAGNRRSTLDSILSNFENMVDKRLDTAYKVRGLEKPQAVSDSYERNKQQDTEESVTTKEPDVDAYAKAHGISYDQALHVKAKKEGKLAGK